MKAIDSGSKNRRRNRQQDYKHRDNFASHRRAQLRLPSYLQVRNEPDKCPELHYRKSQKPRVPETHQNRKQYNFVKPHTALEGRTPAEVVGVGVEGNDKWMELLKKSLEQKNPD